MGVCCQTTKANWHTSTDSITSQVSTTAEGTKSVTTGRVTGVWASTTRRQQGTLEATSVELPGLESAHEAVSPDPQQLWPWPQQAWTP